MKIYSNLSELNMINFFVSKENHIHPHQGSGSLEKKTCWAVSARFSRRQYFKLVSERKETQKSSEQQDVQNQKENF